MKEETPVQLTILEKKYIIIIFFVLHFEMKSLQ